MTFKEAKEQAMAKFEERANYMKRVVEQMDASRDQEIKGYIFRAVADIARKCGVDQSEVWAEMEYWSRSKG